MTYTTLSALKNAAKIALKNYYDDYLLFRPDHHKTATDLEAAVNNSYTTDEVVEKIHNT